MSEAAEQTWEDHLEAGALLAAPEPDQPEFYAHTYDIPTNALAWRGRTRAQVIAEAASQALVSFWLAGRPQANPHPRLRIPGSTIIRRAIRDGLTLSETWAIQKKFSEWWTVHRDAGAGISRSPDGLDLLDPRENPDDAELCVSLSQTPLLEEIVAAVEPYIERWEGLRAEGKAA